MPVTGSPADKSGRALFDKRLRRFPVVLGAAGLHLVGGFHIEQRDQIAAFGAVQIALHQAERDRGPTCQRPMNIADRTQLYREIRRVLKSGGMFAIFDVVLNDGEPHYPVPWARTLATSFLLTAAATRAAIEPAGFRTLAWHDDTEAAKAWMAELRALGSPPSPNLGVVMGPDFAQLSATLGRNLMEGRLGILTAVFEAASVNT